MVICFQLPRTQIISETYKMSVQNEVNTQMNKLKGYFSKETVVLRRCGFLQDHCVLATGLIMRIIIHQIFSLARDWSKRVT